MSQEQLTLIQGGEFIVCDDVVYRPGNPGSISATTSLPVNTMKSASVRLDNEILPLPFLRSQERKVVTDRIRIDGPVAAQIATAMGLIAVPETATAAADRS